MKVYAKSLKQVNKAIQEKYPDIILVRGNGYYYISSDEDAMALKIAGLYTSSIGVYSIKHQTVEQWVKDVENLLKDNF